jgi:chromate reductase, NAD(P)H dehydrogenase (quinone)
MITLVSSTNRKNSLTLRVTKYYQEILKSKGAESTIIDLADLPADFLFTALYHEAGKNEEFNKFRHLIEHSDKFVFIVPEYNSSFPGVLKAFIDGMKYPHSFRNKKAALVGLSAGMMGGTLALSHLTDIFNYLGMEILALKVKLASLDKQMIEDKIDNKLYNELLNQQADQVIKW